MQHRASATPAMPRRFFKQAHLRVGVGPLVAVLILVGPATLLVDANGKARRSLHLLGAYHIYLIHPNPYVNARGLAALLGI